MFIYWLPKQIDRLRPSSPGHTRPLLQNVCYCYIGCFLVMHGKEVWLSPLHKVPSVVSAAQESIKNEVESIHKLSEAASKYPYYKYNGMWSRHVQDAVSTLHISNLITRYFLGQEWMTIITIITIIIIITCLIIVITPFSWQRKKWMANSMTSPFPSSSAAT